MLVLYGFQYLHKTEMPPLMSFKQALSNKLRNTVRRCFHSDGRFWVKHSTSLPRQEIRSLKILQRFILSSKTNSFGGEIHRLNGFLIDNKSNKANRMEQQCCEQQSRLQALFTLQTRCCI